MAEAAAALLSGAPWLMAPCWYGGLITGANLVWEMAQLPFYGLWRDDTPSAITFAILHCTAGDVLIAMTSVLTALLIMVRSSWPTVGAARTSLVATAIGITYTVFREWLNVLVQGSWTYAPTMPVLTPLGTGLLPVLQWLILPPLRLAFAVRAAAADADAGEKAL
jgi:hypothetical protein